MKEIRSIYLTNNITLIGLQNSAPTLQNQEEFQENIL